LSPSTAERRRRQAYKELTQDGHLPRVADTPDKIELFRLLTIEKALQVRADTGMSLTRNMPTVRTLKQRHPHILPQSTRTYRQAYDLWKAYIDKEYRA
jgi:hypothetical protein